MLEQILLKIIHLSLLISLAALFSLSYPDPAGADSLWRKSDNISAKMLFVDYKASRVGDIVTIIISETTQSDYTNESQHEKKSNVLSSITGLLFPAATATTTSTDPLYQNKQYTGSRAGMHNGTLPYSKWDASQKFEGDGAIKSKSSVQARISARVIAVLPNNNLFIEGKRTVQVGEESETIIISGIIRQRDIFPDNTVESQFLADAKIRIEGKGPVTKSKKKGILTKMWEFIGLY